MIDLDVRESNKKGVRDFYYKDIFFGQNERSALVHAEHFDNFLAKNDRETKAICQDKNGRLKHIAREEHFDQEFVTTICETAHAARKIHKFPRNEYLNSLLNYKSGLNFFFQPSSRTAGSFFEAMGILGLRRRQISDISTSSTVKGEWDGDSLRTNSSYHDLVVCRHPSDYFDLFALMIADLCDRDLRYINAGSGKKKHPTQALLDIYTIKESHGRLEDLTVAYVGDCKRGRTIHSLAGVHSLYDNVRAIFVAPEELQIDQETVNHITDNGTLVQQINSGIDDILSEADVIYMTRVQNEHGGKGECDPRFVFTREMLDQMKEGAILMHPLPKREEIDAQIDYVGKDPRLMYWREMRNGMWTRVAEIAYIFGVDDQIREAYQRMDEAIKK